jgi:hypothetical protein
VDLRRRVEHRRPIGESSPTSSNSETSECSTTCPSTTGVGRTVSTTGSITAELAPRDWALWVCAPPGERADTGDVGKYVTVESELD